MLADLEVLAGQFEAVFADLAKVYVADRYSPLFNALCVLCRRPLIDQPFIMYALIQLEPCEHGRDHLPGGAIVRHTTCHPADPEELAAAAATTIGRCYGV